jgi:hypothetical protein
MQTSGRIGTYLRRRLGPLRFVKCYFSITLCELNL